MASITCDRILWAASTLLREKGFWIIVFGFVRLKRDIYITTLWNTTKGHDSISYSFRTARTDRLRVEKKSFHLVVLNMSGTAMVGWIPFESYTSFLRRAHIWLDIDISWCCLLAWYHMLVSWGETCDWEFVRVYIPSFWPHEHSFPSSSCTFSTDTSANPTTRPDAFSCGHSRCAPPALERSSVFKQVTIVHLDTPIASCRQSRVQKLFFQKRVHLAIWEMDSGKRWSQLLYSFVQFCTLSLSEMKWWQADVASKGENAVQNP